MEPTLSPAGEGMDEKRYAEHTAGSVSVGQTLSPAGEGIDGNRYAEHTAGSVNVGPTLSPADEKHSTGDGVRYAHRHTEDGGDGWEQVCSAYRRECQR